MCARSFHGKGHRKSIRRLRLHRWEKDNFLDVVLVCQKHDLGKAWQNNQAGTMERSGCGRNITFSRVQPCCKAVDAATTATSRWKAMFQCSNKTLIHILSLLHDHGTQRPNKHDAVMVPDLTGLLTLSPGPTALRPVLVALALCQRLVLA